MDIFGKCSIINVECTCSSSKEMHVQEIGMERECNPMKKGKGNNIGKILTMFLQITITMLSPLLICGALGVWLNDRFHTTLWFLVMMLVGVLAAFRNFFCLVRGFYESDLKREREEQAYFDDMRKEREQRAETRQKK